MSEHYNTDEAPGFYDLMDNAEAGIIQRSITRYLVPRNYERSIKIHKCLGTPLFSKAVMGTVGRIIPPYRGTNYRLSVGKGRLAAANNFAFKASVFNEVAHTAFVIPQSISVISDAFENGPSLGGQTAGLAINLACVALQRYNRARMVGFLDRRLRVGAEFDYGYRSWTGIDNRAIDNYDGVSARESQSSEIIAPENIETEPDFTVFIPDRQAG